MYFYFLNIFSQFWQNQTSRGLAVCTHSKSYKMHAKTLYVKSYNFLLTMFCTNVTECTKRLKTITHKKKASLWKTILYFGENINFELKTKV